MKPTQRITFTALAAAILAVLSIIPLPFSVLGVPMTLQTFAVAFCGFLLGRRLGPGAVGLYLFLGAIGLPVFSGMQGGFQQFAGPTGGFLYGFLPMAFLCGLAGDRDPAGKPGAGRAVLRALPGILLGFAGLLLCHLCGVLQLSFVGSIPFAAALRGASLPFLPKDLVSVAAAYALALVLRRRLRLPRE